MQAYQASCVAINGRALLIEGVPGSGKSSLALALIDRGAVLIGDDAVMLGATDGHLCAHPHPNTRGLLEVRNLGLLPFTVCEQAPAALVVRLTLQAPRYIEVAESVEIANFTMPMIQLYPDCIALALRAELALERFGLRF